MILLLRAIFVLGMGLAAWYALRFVLLRVRADLRRALWAFGVTAALALLFFAGLIGERLLSG